MAFYIQDHLVTAGCQFFTSRYTGCPIRVFTADTPFRGALVLMRCLELLPRQSRLLILVSSRSMNLGSVSFDDSRLGLVRRLSISFVDFVWLSFLTLIVELATPPQRGDELRKSMIFLVFVWLLICSLDKRFKIFMKVNSNLHNSAISLNIP